MINEYDVLQKLKNVKGSRPKWTARCPSHDDKNNSLSIGIGDNEQVLLHCFVGCPYEKIMDALGLGRGEHKATTPRSKIVAEYDYTDEQGELLYQCVRLEPKTFRQRRPDGQGKWIWGLNAGEYTQFPNGDWRLINDKTPSHYARRRFEGVRRVLYRLPQLLEANKSETVFIVEGEKDADRLASLGLVATTNSGGASKGESKWRDEYSEHLRGRHVIILPDNDEAGYAHAEKVAASLQGIAASVRGVQLPDLQEKGDVTDWLNAGGTVEQLKAYVSSAEPLPLSVSSHSQSSPEENTSQGNAAVSVIDERQLDALSPFVSTSPLVPSDFPSDVLESLVNANLTDVGNSECLIKLCGDKLRYCHTRKKWFVWDGVRWGVDGNGIAQLAAVYVARARQQAAVHAIDIEARRRLFNWALSSENYKRVVETLKMAQAVPPFSTRIDQYDAAPLLAATTNGTLDLNDGSFRESSSDDYLTMQLGAAYVPDADASRWMQFLDEVFGGDVELIEYVKRAVGYSLTGDTSAQCLFLCYGHGANGKSVFLEVLSRLLGDYAGAASFETFDAGRRSEASNDLAALKGKRFVTVIETEEDKRLAEAKVKAVTGEDVISCRFLYGEFFSYRPQFKIWMAMNHKPVIRGTDRGIWRRLHILPFTKSFEGREDRMLKAKLHDELSGILNWALDGLRKWRKDGLRLPKAVQEATEDYRRESDSIGLWIEERTCKAAAAIMQAGVAYQDYSEWAKSRGEYPMSQKNWGGSMTERGYKREHNRRGNMYLGIGLGQGDVKEVKGVNGLF
jgi:putative DNA primase/helicase